MNSCEVCEMKTNKRCSNCNQAYYCTIDHQLQHWKSHKVNCHAFKIEKNERLGRHLVATRNIKPFEIILKESPLVRGPSQLTAPVCLGCLNRIEPSNYINCIKCGWPLCGIECKNKSEHDAECNFTIARGTKIYGSKYSVCDTSPLKEFTGYTIDENTTNHCCWCKICLLLFSTSTIPNKKSQMNNNFANHDCTMRRFLKCFSS